MGASAIPQPPPGYTLDQQSSAVPPPPPGYTLDGQSSDPSNTQAPPQRGALSRLFSNFGENFFPSTTASDYIQGPLYALRHPIDSAKLLGSAIANSQQEQQDASNKAKEAGDTYGAAVHGIAAAIPLIGPASEKAGEQIGSGDIAGGLGSSAGIISQLLLAKYGPKAVAKAGDIAKSMSAPMADAMTKTPAAGRKAPAAAVTPKDVADFADQKGIKLTAAQATENKGLRNLQSVGERASFGGQKVVDMTDAAHGAISDSLDNLANQADPRGAQQNAPATGQRLQGDIQNALEREQAQSRQMFAAVDQQAKGVMVDARPVKQLASQLMEDSAFTREKTPSMNPSQATKVVRDAAALDDQMTFKQAQELRSSLLDEARKPENAINDKAQGWIKQLTGATDQTMMDAARQRPGAVNGDTANFQSAMQSLAPGKNFTDLDSATQSKVLAEAQRLKGNGSAAKPGNGAAAGSLEQAFRAANEHWKGLQEDFNSPRSPLNQAIKEPKPENVPQKFLSKGTTGGASSSISLLEKYGIDPGPLKREMISDLVDKRFSIGDNKLAGYSDQFLRSVFSPQELSDIYKSGRIYRSVLRNTNNSGTSDVLGAQTDLAEKGGVIRGTKKYIAAKLTTSPGFNSWMTRTQPGKIAQGFANATKQVTRGRVAAAVGGARSEEQR